ncbi:hypothetical protein E2C01_061871 [Portunus trituberculatus]|uniref:Uncharacterized protein n=1 Tax=Portunus trituberculatus TaxID=210409 RepID=A0A5B7H511_PORTR|nr:hypothetical protein [Portunus trituberculatus]
MTGDGRNPGSGSSSGGGSTSSGSVGNNNVGLKSSGNGAVRSVGQTLSLRPPNSAPTVPSSSLLGTTGGSVRMKITDLESGK